MKFDWQKTVATVAPSIATALGGPLAGTAVTALTKAVLGEASTDTAALESALATATPEVLAKVKEAELAFERDMAALDVDLERIAAGDRDSARGREAAIRDWVPSVLGILLVLGFFAAFGAMLWVPLSDSAQRPIDIMLGYLGGMASGVSTYYFGSSAGSARKNELLAKAGK